VPSDDATARSAADADPVGRLPTTVRPERYDLRLAPDLATSTFRGEATVTLDVRTPTSELVCNAAELEMTEAWVDLDGRRIDGEVGTDAEQEQVRVALPERLPAGAATLHLTFSGVLNDRLRGFYRSTFSADGGGDRTIAVTQFEPTDARRAFPCWDEPEFKAVFGVTLDVADDLLAVSNGPELSREDLGDGRVRIRFADTMPMSTYLVAFVVGPMETTGPVDVDGVPLRIVHRPGQGELAEFALEVGAFALRFFADYYGIAYPGDKVDMVAVPDFAFGAMENLGCVVYRETLLLVDPESATQSELLAVVDVIAHELAHMWFGDLVTMRWWNGIWLNEAFATFMEAKCSAAFRPGWERWMHFGRERSGAFDVDALATTRPIEYPVHTPADAEGMFDTLTYQKGSAVVRMLEQYLGEDAFRDGIRRYLQTHQFGNTETGDLWDALEAVTGEPVRAMMDSWIFQGGFPLVTASAREGSLHLTQQPFRFTEPCAARPAASASSSTMPAPRCRWPPGRPVPVRSWSTPAATPSTGCPTSPSCAARSSTDSPASSPSSATPSSTTPTASPCAAIAEPASWPISCNASPTSARPTSPCGSWPRRASSSSIAPHPRTSARRSRPGCAGCSPRWPDSWATMSIPTTTTVRGPCAVWSWACEACTAMPTPSPAPSRCSTNSCTGRVRSTPSSAPAR
jgi:aminopeptidase N